MSKLINIYVNARNGWEFRDQLKALGFTYRGCRGTVSFTIKVDENKPDDTARAEANAFIAKAKASMPKVEFSLKEYTTADRDAKKHKHPSAKASKAQPVQPAIDPVMLAAIVAALKQAS